MVTVNILSLLIFKLCSPSLIICMSVAQNHYIYIYFLNVLPLHWVCEIMWNVRSRDALAKCLVCYTVALYRLQLWFIVLGMYSQCSVYLCIMKIFCNLFQISCSHEKCYLCKTTIFWNSGQNKSTQWSLLVLRNLLYLTKINK